RRDVYDLETGQKTRRYETVSTRIDEAKARLRGMDNAVAKGERISDSNATMQQMWDGFKVYRQEKAKPVKPRTADSQDADWKLYIGPRFAPERVRDINDRLVVERFLGGLKRQSGKDKPLNGGTKARVLATLSAVLDLAVKERVIDANACHQIQ